MLPLQKSKSRKKRPQFGKVLKTFNQQFKIIIFTEDQFRIGRGGWGNCYLGLYTDTHHQKKNQNLRRIANHQGLVVVKQISKKSKPHAGDIYKRQIQSLSKASGSGRHSDHLVRIYPYTFQSESNYYVVMEYCQNASLDRFIERRRRSRKYFSFEQFCQIMMDLFSGYEGLKSHRIIHDDLKPDNIFIKDKSFKIGDFGFAFRLNNLGCMGRGGTQDYNAPQKYTSRQINHKSDIYALGIILYQILFDRHPYINKQQLKQFKSNYIQSKQQHIDYTIMNQNIIKKLKNQAYLKYINGKSIKQSIDSEIQIPQMYAQKFKVIKPLVISMCSLNAEKRPSFEVILGTLQPLHLQRMVKRQLLFPDLKEFIQGESQFEASALSLQGFSDLLQDSICKSIYPSLKWTDIKKKRVQQLKDHIIQTNSQSRILSDMIQRLKDYNREDYYWKLDELQFKIKKYLLLNNLEQLEYARNQIASMNQDEQNQVYNHKIDCLLKILRQNRDFMYQEVQVQQDAKKCESARKDVMKHIHNIFEISNLQRDNYEEVLIQKLIFQLLETYEKGVDSNKNAISLVINNCKEQLQKIDQDFYDFLKVREVMRKENQLQISTEILE